jgi:hypothetical protein
MGEPLQGHEGITRRSLGPAVGTPNSQDGGNFSAGVCTGLGRCSRSMPRDRDEIAGRDLASSKHRPTGGRHSSHLGGIPMQLMAHEASSIGACAQIIPTTRPAMVLKARCLRIVGAEFIAKELAACGTPRLQFAVLDGKGLSAERTARGRVNRGSACAHQMPPDFALARKIIPWPVGFPSHPSSCEYRHSRVDRQRLSRERHTSIENM